MRDDISSRFGCMHLLATNLAMWIHIVIKESVLEISHVQDHEDSTPEVFLVEAHFPLTRVDSTPICFSVPQQYL